MQEGTVDWFLREIGGCLDDYSLTRSADSILGRTRVMQHFQTAQMNVHLWLRTHGCHPSHLVRKVTITEDPENDNRYILPPRCYGVWAIEDSNGLHYSPLRNELFTGHGGWCAERRASTNGRNNQLVVRFLGYEPTGTVYAHVIERPVELHAGDGAAYAATSITFATTPDAGQLIEDNDYYNGSQVIVTESGDAAFGLIGTITDFVGLTRVATVPTWASTPTTSDAYSLLCELPPVTYRWLVLEAALILTRVDKRLGEMRDDLVRELASANDPGNSQRILSKMALKQPAAYYDSAPRTAEVWYV